MIIASMVGIAIFVASPCVNEADSDLSRPLDDNGKASLPLCSRRTRGIAMALVALVLLLLLRLPKIRHQAPASTEV